MKSILLSLMFFIGLNIPSYGQLDENNGFNDFHLGATASGGTINNNLFTGVANVTIPLFQYSVEGINADVFLSYNTSGLQVDEIASNVGLGWTLNYGGFIRRQIRGERADENNGHWFDLTYDKEPDIYYINFNNRSFKVFFSHLTNNYVTIPQSDIRIKRYVGGVLVTSGSTPGSGPVTFVVTDEQGNQYTFDRGLWVAVNTVEWYLKEVKTYEGKIITYNYSSYSSSYYVLEKRGLWQRFGVSMDYNGDASVTHQETIESHTYKIRLNSIDYPNGISLTFSYDGTARCDLPGDYRLASIDVKERNPPSGLSSIKYTYTFNHAYFLSPTFSSAILTSSYPTSTSSEATSCGGADTRYRLKLKSIDLTGFNSSVAPMRYYSFEYMNLPLPERVYGMKDRFGYANNQVPGSFIPCRGGGSGCTYPPYAYNSSVYVGTSFANWSSGGIGGSSCNSMTSNGTNVGTDYASSNDPNYVGASVLKKITNQASGEISILYKSLWGDHTMNGGLVVDEIKYFDGYSHDNDYSYKYDYTDGFHNFDGILTEGGSNTWSETSYLHCASSAVSSNNSCRDNTFSILNTGLNGSRYGFKTVTTYLKNNSGATMSKTISKFSGIGAETSHGIATSNYFNPSTYSGLSFGFRSANKQYFRDWAIGLPLTTTNYDMNNNITSYTENTYQINTTHNNSSQYKGAYSKSGISEDYYPFSGNTQITSIKSRSYYSNTGYTETTINMQYSGNDLLQTSYVNSEGQTIREYNRYNYAISTTNAAINHLTSDGLHRVIYKDKWMEMSSATLIQNNVSGQTIVSGDIIRPNYNYFLKTPATPLVSVSSPGTYYADIAGMSGGGAVTNYKLAGGVTKYDDIGLPIESSDLNTTYISNTYNSNIFDNERGHLLASASNAKHQEVAYCGFESDYSFSSPYNRGNWDFVTSNVSTDHALLGRCSYHCTSSAGLWSHTSTAQLVYGKQYTVSFWVYGSGSVFANDGGSTTVWTPAVATYTIPGTSDVWTLHKGTFTFAGTGSTVGIGVWGDGYIDELKVYPSDCIMETHCYLPIKGKVADVDANDNITSYEHDNYGNVFLIRDFNGNILSKSKTVIQGY